MEPIDIKNASDAYADDQGLYRMLWEEVQSALGFAISKIEVIESSNLLDKKNPGTPAEAVAYAILELCISHNLKVMFPNQKLTPELTERVQDTVQAVMVRVELFFRDKKISATINPEGCIVEIEVWRRTHGMN